MKFNPKPGDKIICNNGEEFICCTLEFLRETISVNVRPLEPVLGYNEKHSQWQDWEFSGQARGGGTKYSIREVIPQSSEVIDDKKEEVKEEPRYSLQEIEEAWGNSCDGWGDFKKELMKINNPEYKEYLRLKAIYK